MISLNWLNDTSEVDLLRRISAVRSLVSDLSNLESIDVAQWPVSKGNGTGPFHDAGQAG